MTAPRLLNIKDYSYELPEDRIAKFPLEKRDESKLLVYKNGSITDSVFTQLYKHLPSNSLIVFNNTKVIHARILFERITGALIEVFCLEPLHPHDYAVAFTTTHSCIWKCMVGNAKRWKDDVLTKTVTTPAGQIALSAKLIDKTDDAFTVEFSWNTNEVTFGELLFYAGILPIPPYLNRETTDEDEQRYQTIYASCSGSVAAPTAGLHFTEYVFETLKQQHIKTSEVTLHVGAGTFKPVKSDSLKDHTMHEELMNVSKESIQDIISSLHTQSPITAVGTTSVRTLESIYWLGVQLLNGKKPVADFFITQWEPYDNSKSISALQSLEAVYQYMLSHHMDQITGSTPLIKAPGHALKLVDAILTNFHQPENTLMLLVAAFTGSDWRKIYDYALSHDYRFLSYGDSSLLFRS
ncbi:MAG: S-adenosylmethionine:tRNA ribosyltransferase-isomerase [Bacteroidota bacterium]